MNLAGGDPSESKWGRLPGRTSETWRLGSMATDQTFKESNKGASSPLLFYSNWEEKPPSLEEAQRFCRQLARSRYENFLVATLFLPGSLRQHFFNIYSYCRISDDLGDQCGDPQRGLDSLRRWEEELQACYRGQVRHPVFIALRETIETFQIPIRPFADLLVAFRRDQVQRRYRTYEELLDYCRYSANPVGHLVLYLGGYSDPERQLQSDYTCTALQLANHWQDIHLDLVRLDRVYLPAEDMEKFGYGVDDLRAQRCDERFVRLMQLEVGRTRELFHRGLKLSDMVDPRLSLEIELFGRCGLELLKRIEAVHYDVFRRRPTVSTGARIRLLVSCWTTRYRRK